MPTTFSWATAGSIVTDITTSAAFTDGSTQVSTAVDNSTTGLLYIDFEFNMVNSATTGAGAPYVAVWLLSSLDGTLFEDGSGTILNPRAPDAIFPLRASVLAAQVVNAVNVPAPAYQFKVLFYNKAGVSLNAATIRHKLHNELGT